MLKIVVVFSNFFLMGNVLPKGNMHAREAKHASPENCLYSIEETVSNRKTNIAYIYIVALHS